MPISEGSLKAYLSGGSSNDDPLLSLGGDPSSTTVPTGLFDPVNGDESAIGDISYRLFYVKNESTNEDGWINPVMWIDEESVVAGYAFALAAAGKNGSEDPVDDEATAPAGVSFASPTTKADGIALPDGPYLQNDFVGIWVRRTVPAGAPSADSDPIVFAIEGDTV